MINSTLILTKTGFVIIDLFCVFIVVIQNINFGLNSNIAAAINSVAILGITIITTWTAAKAAQIKKVADATHILSNSAMGAQLKLNVQFATASAVQLHRIAELTETDGDKAAAVAADIVVKEQEELLQAHLVQQAKVDAKNEN